MTAARDAGGGSYAPARGGDRARVAGAAPGTTGRDLAIAGLLATLILVTHVLSPIRTSFDSRWTIPTALSLVHRGDADVDEYGHLMRRWESYGIEQRAGHAYSRMPIGPSLLAIPVVVAYDALAAVSGLPSAEQLVAEERGVALEVVVASLTVAGAGVLVFLTARACGLGAGAASLLMLVFAFCTPAWSTGSRGLWQHGPSMLTDAAALYLLVRARRRDVWAAVAALPLAFGFLVRPTNAIPLAVLGAYVAWRHPRRIVAFAALAALVLLPFFAVNLLAYGSPLTSYYRLGNQPAGPWAQMPWAALGHLVSPNRGLLVFSPVVLFGLAGIFVKQRSSGLEALDVALVAILLLHFVVISAFYQWWAGHSYGPRYTTDLLPLLVYFMIPTLAAAGQLAPRPRRRFAVLFAVLAAWSFFVELRAATTWDVWAWNGSPVGIDERPERAWDWRDMQILRGLGKS